MNKKVFSIKGMHCKSCEILTEEELGKISGVKKADTDFRSGKAVIFYDGEVPSDSELEAAVRRSGYSIGGNDRPWFSRDLSVYLEAVAAAVLVGVFFLIGRNHGWFSLSFGSAESLDRLSVVFFAGIVAGLSTCMAIVGGMVLAISARFSELHPEANVKKKFHPHIFFNIGRVGGFAIFGGLLGLLGSMIQPSSGFVGVLTVFVAVVMVLLGLQLLELFPRLSAWKVTLPKGLAKILGIQARTQKEYSHKGTMLLGALTFFLPCGFTQAVQLLVITQGDVFLGAISMGMFALGTAPGLLGIGALSAAAKGIWGRYFFRMAGVVVISLGVFNVQNGVHLLSLGKASATISEPRSSNGEQIVQKKNEPVVLRMDQVADGYIPNEFTVKKGQPVRWIVDSKESYSCAVSLVAPKIGVRKILKSGENVIEFTPKVIGDIPFSCSMGMYRGVIHVTQ